MIGTAQREQPGLGFAWVIAAPLIASAASSALSALLGRQRGAQKIAATTAANQIADVLQANAQEYFAGPRTAEHQAHHLQVFDDAWAWLASGEGCGDPALGSAGQRCIEERRRGGSAPWCPTGTGCDWFTVYRDPIAQDTPATTGGAFDELTSPLSTEGAAGLAVSPALLIAATLIVIGVVL